MTMFCLIKFVSELGAMWGSFNHSIIVGPIHPTETVIPFLRTILFNLMKFTWWWTITTAVHNIWGLMGTLLCIYVDTLSLSRWMPTVRNAGQPLAATSRLSARTLWGKAFEKPPRTFEKLSFSGHTHPPKVPYQTALKGPWMTESWPTWIWNMNWCIRSSPNNVEVSVR